jgi:uncharacterized sulfatase
MVKIPMVARWPGHIPSGRRSAAMQTLVDFAPTVLSACGIEVPRSMTGVDQLEVWCDEADRARDHVLVENRHQPTTLHVKTYVDERYKITVYYGREYGELFDLEEDPGEIHNLWDDPAHADLKAELVMKLLQAELEKEPLPMPRIAVA